MKHIKNHAAILLLLACPGCTSLKEKRLHEQVVGKYETKYQYNRTLAGDTVLIKIALYDFKTREPLDFTGGVWGFSKLPQETTMNVGIRKVHKSVLPEEINVYRHGNYPFKIKPIILKPGKNEIHYKVYLRPDIRGVI